jgi:hypothetical protein
VGLGYQNSSSASGSMPIPFVKADAFNLNYTTLNISKVVFPR